jgi:hypothetical protein
MFTLYGLPLQLDHPFSTREGTQYPANWLRLASPEERAAIGITEEADPVRHDDRFYWNGDITLPKDLAGLKTQFGAQVKDTAGKLLAQTDWMIIRQVERSVDVPSDVVEYRSAIVAEELRLEAAITSVATVEELIEIVGAQEWPTMNKEEE